MLCSLTEKKPVMHAVSVCLSHADVYRMVLMLADFGHLGLQHCQQLCFYGLFCTLINK